MWDQKINRKMQKTNFHNVYNQILEFEHDSNDSYRSQSKRRLLYTWNNVSSLINSNSTVVEIGSGPMAALAKEIGKANVICIDITESNASLCKHYGMDLRICDIQSSPIPVEDKSVDVIFLLEVIEHLCMYPSDLFDQIFTKLKSGGYIVVSSTNFMRITNRIRVFFGKSPLINFFERTIDGRNHIREFISDEMAYYIEKSGFKISQKSMFGIPYGTALISILLRLLYKYPNFRNYFLIIGRKP